ncbi:MAG: hypothetical protein KDD40_04460 [Bdellovibrionales bacterium]|nr:hypothetical protein [Bdellovibrionales bacterium]
MLLKLFVVVFLLYISQWVHAKDCQTALLNKLSYSGGYLEPLPEWETYQNLVIQVSVRYGILVDNEDQPIQNPMGSQFVINGDHEFLMTKDPTIVDHRLLGRRDVVYFAGYMAVEQGHVTSLMIQETSAYKSNPQNLVRLIFYLESLGLDLSHTKFSISRNEDPLFEINREQVMNLFNH